MAEEADLEASEAADSALLLNALAPEVASLLADETALPPALDTLDALEDA